MMLAGLLACADSGFTDLEVAPAEAVSTVLEVRWRDDDPEGQAWVEHGPAGEGRTRRSVEVEAAPGWRRVLVLGYPALTEVELVPVVEREGVRQEGRVLNTSTGALPAGMPVFELLDWDTDVIAPGYLLGAGMGSNFSAVYVLNRDAELVWYRLYEWGIVTMDVEEDLRGGLVASLAHLDDNTFGAVDRFGWDGEDTEQLSLPAAHHACEQPERGVYACIQADIRENSDGIATIGDRLVELHPDGEQVEVFNAWDSLTYREHDRMQGRPEGLDWTHANGLHWSASRGSYLMSFRNLDTLLEIDRETGDIVRSMGVDGELRVVPDTESFRFPHSPSWVDDNRLLLFDSQSFGEDFPSRVVEFIVDEEAGQLRPDWIWTPGDGRTVPALGEVERLDSGRTLTDWGTFGEIIEVGTDNLIAWRAVARAGFILGEITPIELWEPVE